MKANMLVGGVIVAGLAVGCSTTGRRVSQTQVDTIRVGDSKSDVQARIGAPDQVGTNLSGETWIYSYSKSRPNAKRFIPLLGTFIGGKNVESQTITVAFDSQGRVADVATAYRGKDAMGRPITNTTGSGSSSEKP